MEFDAALREFAGLLIVGSAALQNLVRQTDNADLGVLPPLFLEIDGLAKRLLAIADECSDLSAYPRGRL